MLNEIQERKRCNRLVIIPWRNTIPFQELIGDHFGVDVNRNRNHFKVGIISGAVHLTLRHLCSALSFSLLALNQDYL